METDMFIAHNTPIKEKVFKVYLYVSFVRVFYGGITRELMDRISSSNGKGEVF